MQPVILADVVESKRFENLAEIRNRKLAEISRGHIGQGWVEYEYAVTAGDEFQNIVVAARHVPSVLFDLRRRFRPLGLWIAIGVGQIATFPTGSEPVNVGGTGEAFELAREAMNFLRDTPRSPSSRAFRAFKRKYAFSTAFRSQDNDSDVAVNIIYRLLDTLLDRTTERQWETINAYEDLGRADRAAARLGVDESTVSRNLSRGSYWQALDAITALARILESRWP